MDEDVKKLLQNIPRGRPKSGQVWKADRLRTHRSRVQVVQPDYKTGYYSNETLTQRCFNIRPTSSMLAQHSTSIGHSEMKKGKPLRSSWDIKMKQKAEKKQIMQYERELKDSKMKKLQAINKRREENKKRKLENSQKSDVVQKITNTAKLKRMKKKQLRKLEKR